MRKTVKYHKTSFLLLKNHVKLPSKFLLKLFIFGTFEKDYLNSIEKFLNYFIIFLGNSGTSNRNSSSKLGGFYQQNSRFLKN